MFSHVRRAAIVAVALAAIAAGCGSRTEQPAPTSPTSSTLPPASPAPAPAADQLSCRYEVTPVFVTLPRDTWSGEISIATASGCQWTATTTAPWLQLRSSSGTGAGTLTYDADFNPETRYGVRRAGVVEIRWAAPTAGQNVSFTQWGYCNVVAAPNVLPAGAALSASPTSGTLTIGADGGTVRLFVLTDPFMGCAWSMESSDTWISWEFPKLHSVQGGDGDTRFVVPPNPSTNGRTATATLGGWPLTVVQRGR